MTARPGVYLVMAVWMIVGSTIRVSLQVSNGYPLDAIPFLTVALAIYALTVYFRHPRKEPQ